MPKVTYSPSSKTKIHIQVLGPGAFTTPAVLTAVWSGDPGRVYRPVRGVLEIKTIL